MTPVDPGSAGTGVHEEDIMTKNIHELEKTELIQIIERLVTERDQLQEALLAIDSYQNSKEYEVAKKYHDAVVAEMWRLVDIEAGVYTGIPERFIF